MEDFKDVLVKYKTAQKAKQKGFHAFVPHHFVRKNIIVGGWIKGDKKPSRKDIEAYLKNPEATLVAPTQQLLRVWIEKRKKLSVSVVFKIEKGRMKYVPCIANLKTKTVETLPKSFFSYKTAMERGLFYALS